MTMTARPEPWMLTAMGGIVPFFSPRPNDIAIGDIAWALSMKARFNGHTRRQDRSMYRPSESFYSVAQHSCLICDRIEEMYPNDHRLHLQALLHDAEEAYLPDVHTEMKACLGAFRDIAHIFKAAIRERFDLGEEAAMIKDYDRRMLATERRDLMWQGENDWRVIEGIEPFPQKIELWDMDTAYTEFLERFRLTSNPDNWMIA